MAEENLEIKAANLRVELNYLLQAIPERSAELSVLHRNIEKAQSDYNQILDQQNQVESDCSKQIEDIAVERNNLQVQKRTIEVQQLEWSKTLSIIKDEVKIANKELRWVNDKIFKGEAEVLDIENKKIAIQKDIDEMVILVARIDELKTSIGVFEDYKQKITSEISSTLDASDKQLADARKEYLELEDKTHQRLQESAQAEFRVKTYTDELYSHMNDYAIVRARIEQKWNQTFPELDLPLN